MCKTGGRVKRSGYKGGRGYCGYYTNIDGKKMFLRSIREFIYAKKLDSESKHFLTEKDTYFINGKNYKPDFFIYDESYNKLIEIVEIKGNIADTNLYNSLYINEFKSMGIKYSCVYIDSRKKYNYLDENDIKSWIKSYESNYGFFNYKKENNPMYGMHHTKNAKMKIGKATTKYMMDPKIKKKHSDSIKAFWNSEDAIPIKEKYRELRMLEKEINNPIVSVICKNCGNTYTRRKNDRFLIHFCSSSCHQKYNWKIGKNSYHGDAKKSYKTKMILYGKRISELITEENLVDIIKKYKSKNIIPVNFGMNLQTIEKYFGTLSDFIKEIKNG